MDRGTRALTSHDGSPASGSLATSRRGAWPRWSRSGSSGATAAYGPAPTERPHAPADGQRTPVQPGGVTPPHHHETPVSSEPRATGAWLVELAKRARHIGLWLIAITQQRSDLASREGRALLDNSTIQLFLRNGPHDIAHIAEALHLSTEEVAQISRLVTEKHSHAEAYLVNGERGRGGVTIRLGSHAYWLATSDPVVDVPWRELALEESGAADARDPVQLSDAAFRALDLLADPEWQTQPR